MMISKLIIPAFVLFPLFFNENLALDAENYTAYIEELSHDEKFLEEYTKWSLELFSQADYLYGSLHGRFPCSVEKPDGNHTIPTSVHTLRPSDVKCIGAMGDSLTTGLAAHAITPVGLVFENRGISWSIGGDYTYSKFLSIPNALREYNSNLEGFSTKVSGMLPNGQDDIDNGLNVAKSGDRSIHMPVQAELLIDRIIDEKLCDWNNDWKVITFSVGGNDLCSFCEDSNVTKHTPKQYMTYVRDTLDVLYNAPIPRTLVNLVLTPDVRGVKELNSGGYICQVLNKRICPCAAFPTVEQAKILDDYIPRYDQVLFDLINTGRYDGRDDFTVVIQPFMAKTQLPYKDNHKIDFSYFAPDCFHFSGKGHSQAALSLWNNMFEPVGGKQWSWHMNKSLKCPTKEYPYIFTSKNSAKALNELETTTIGQTINRASIISSGSTTNIRTVPQHHYPHDRKHEKSDSDSLFNKIKFIVITGFVFIIILILVFGFIKRRKVGVVIPENRRRHFFAVNNEQQPDDDDDDDGDVEIWNRSNIKSSYLDNNETTKTHGTRISFE